MKRENVLIGPSICWGLSRQALPVGVLGSALLLGCGKSSSNQNSTDAGVQAGASATPTPASSTPTPTPPLDTSEQNDDAPWGDDDTTPTDNDDTPPVSDDDTDNDNTPTGDDDETGLASDDDTDDDVPLQTPTPDIDAGSQPILPEDLLPPETAPRRANKLDLLFVIDNSMSMTSHQQLLADSLPELLERLLTPPCRDPQGNYVPSASDACPAGSQRDFQPLEDIHVGVITTSLGGFGSELNCSNINRETGELDPNLGQADMSHLLGSLPRAAGSGAGDFLRWCSGASDSAGDCTQNTEGNSALIFTTAFQHQLLSAGEQGCGFEASLESWYRFLIEPSPWTQIERQPCSADEPEGQNLCVGPETTDGTPLAHGGTQAVDQVLLAQRAAFLREDSVVAIVMLTDENDCSFKVTGQSWRLSTTETLLANGNRSAQRAFKGTSECQTDPNSNCCYSCGLSPRTDCPSEVNEDGITVGQGCGRRLYESTTDGSPTGDAANLRCFEQKRRFGVDYLYPIERYSNGLRYTFLCSSRDDATPLGCDPSALVENPLFKSADGTEERRRPASRVFLAGILGAPWQDLAVDHTAPELVYRNNRATSPAAERIDWSLLLGDNGEPPADPLMIEQVDPRTGVHPITDEPVAPPDSAYGANSINGHEWNIADRDDLQYACVYPLPEPRTCSDTNSPCECNDPRFGDALYQNPVCQQPDGSYGLTQRFAKAYPGVRQLRVLRDFGDNAVVTSLCARQTGDPTSPDYAYRPALRALVSALGREL